MKSTRLTLRRALNRYFLNWARRNLKSLKQITWGVYDYRFGMMAKYRLHMKRTSASWFFCRPMWVSVDWISAPEFRAAVCDGHGEHYGYPRHYAYVMLWWNHRGYACGVEFNAKQKD